MSKRYIVAVGSSNEKQTDAFLKFIEANDLYWWHWLENFWLIIDSKNQVNIISIRNELEITHPETDNLVIELNDNGDTWAGYGPSTEEKNMFNWLKKTWDKLGKE